MRNCRRFLRGGRPCPWPMRAAWIVPVPLRNARGRVSRPLTTRAPRATASTITLSAPAANRAWAAASAVLPVVITSSTNATCRPRTPCPRNTPARAARRSRQPRLPWRFAQAQQRARPQRQIQRGRQAAGDLHGRVHAAPTQRGPAGRYGGQHRIGRQGASRATAAQQARQHRRQRQAQPGLQLTDQGHARRLVVECHDGAQVGGRPAQAARAQRAGWRRRCAQRGQRAPGSRQLRVTSASQPAHRRAPRTRAPHSGQSQPMADASRDHSCRPARRREIGTGGPDAQ